MKYTLMRPKNDPRGDRVTQVMALHGILNKDLITQGNKSFFIIDEDGGLTFAGEFNDTMRFVETLV